MSAESKPELSSDFCPYQGLEPYTEAQREYFFGRERDIKIIISNLHGTPLSVLYGASGVGKSSVLLAGVVPELKRTEGLAVAVWREWQSENFAVSLKQAVLDAVRERLIIEEQTIVEELEDEQTVLDAVSERLRKEIRTGVTRPYLSLPFDDLLSQCNQALDGPIFLIFDQWEEYFLYHPPSRFGSGFETEFARAVNRRDIRANFMLSMREEELSKMDRFRNTIPNLLGNMLRLRHLDRDAAKRAIVEPLRVFNKRVPEDRQMTIEDKLTQDLIEKAQQSQSGPGQANPLTPDEQRIETPVLQMLLTRLWQKEREQSSPELKAATLEGLGGAENIVASHFGDAIKDLSDAERDTAANIFRYLVTSAGTKIGQMANMLAEWAELPLDQVTSLLDQLSVRPNLRILRKLTVAGRPDHYEIFHDVLGPAIRAWVQQHRAKLEAKKEADEQERERKARRTKLGLVALSALTLIMVALTGFALEQKASAEKASSDAKLAQAEAEKSAGDAKWQEIEANCAKTDADRQRGEAIKQKNLADDQRRGAEKATERAISSGLVSDSTWLLQADPELSANLAYQAIQKSPTEQAIATLKQALIQSGVLNTLGRNQNNIRNNNYFLFNGKLAVTTNAENQIRIWEVSTGKELFAPRPDAERSRTVEFGNRLDDKLLVITDSKNQSQIWDIKNKILLAPENSAESIRADFGPAQDSVLVVTTNNKTQSQVWDIARGELLAPKEEKEIITSYTFSTDGKLLGAAGNNGRIRIFEAATGKELPAPKGSAGTITSIVFSPDNKRFVTTNDKKQILCWKAETGEEIFVAKDLSEITEKPEFSPNGELIILTHSQNQKRIFEAASGSNFLVPEGVAGAVIKAGFGPNNKVIVTQDSYFRVWDAVTGKELFIPQDSTERIVNVEIPSNGRLAVITSNNYQNRVWDIPRRELLAPVGSTEFVTRYWLSHGNKRLAAAGSNGQIRIFEISSGKELSTPKDMEGVITAISFSPDSKLVVATNDKLQVRIWDAETGKEQFASENVNESIRIADFGPTPDGKLLVISNSNDQSQVWNLERTALLAPKENGETIKNTNYKFSPDNQFLITAGSNGRIRIFEIASGNERFSFKDAEAGIQAIDFRPDSKLIVTMNDKTHVKIWDIADGKEMFVLPNKELSVPPNIAGGIIKADFDTAIESKLLVTMDNNNRHQVWNIESKELLAPREDGESITKYQSSPDRKLLATMANNGRIRIFETASGKELSAPKDAEGDTIMIGWSFDNKLVITTNTKTNSKTSDIRIWDALTGDKLKAYDQIDKIIHVHGFSPDKKFFVTSQDENNVNEGQIWKKQTGEKMFVPKDKSEIISQVRFSEDGRFVATLNTYRSSTYPNSIILPAQLPFPLFSPFRKTSLFESPTSSPFPPLPLLPLSSGSGICRVWDSSTGKELFAIGEGRERIVEFDFSWNSKLIITTNEKGRTQFYSIEELTKIQSPEELQKVAKQLPPLTPKEIDDRRKQAQEELRQRN